MQTKDIFERELAGEVIALTDPEYHRIDEIQVESQKIIAELNTGYRDKDAVRQLFSRLTGAPVHGDFWLMPPFSTDFGRNIRVGERVFILKQVSNSPMDYLKHPRQKLWVAALWGCLLAVYSKSRAFLRVGKQNLRV